MSYILDALKSSDRERKKGSLPNLQTPPDQLLPPAPLSTRPRRRKHLLWIPLVLLAAVPAWLVLRTGLPGPGEPPAPAPAMPATPDTGPPVAAAPPVGAEMLPPSPPAVDDDTLDALKDVQLDAAPIVELVAADSPAPEDGTAGPPTVPPEAHEPEAAPAPEAAPPESAAVEPAANVAPAPVYNPYAGIPHQHELPPAVQSALPELEITVHIYSDTPSSRLARINRRTYQEGDVIEGQLTLDEITPDGLILSFGDIRYWRYVN